MNQFISQYAELLAKGTWDTIVMTGVATFFSCIFGLILGILLIHTSPSGLRPNKIISLILGWIVNIGRSIPFIILLVSLIPLTRLITGTSLGVAGAVVPLVVAATPFVARLVEQSLSEVDFNLIEAALSFGASIPQITWKVYLKESVPSLIRGASIVFVTLFGYSAIAGTIGAGGLGDIAIRYGYQRYQDSVMVAAVFICIVLVQIVQTAGDRLAIRFDKKRIH